METLTEARLAGCALQLNTEPIAVWSRVGDSWQAARETHLRRERKSLLRRLRSLDRGAPGFPEQVRRLVLDVQHHRQRINDLVYDTVDRDLGGSE